MFYKVIKDNRVIDVLDNITYLKWKPKHQRMVLTNINDAQAILASDNNTIWHEETLYDIPVEGYETVRLEKIDKFEYEQLKVLYGKSPEEIIDLYTLFLIESGVL